MEEETESGISLGEIMHLIGKRILWILLASVLAAVAAALIFAFVLSPRKKEYSISFMIEYPGSQQSLVYPGTDIPFRYESMVYEENLKAVKESNAEFSDINVQSMAKGAISIEEEKRVEGENKAEVGIGIYTVTVKGEFFKDNGQATAFLKALCDYSMQDIMESVDEMVFDQDISSYNALPTYAKKIAALERQQSRLLGIYDKYTGNYGDFKYENKTLNTYRSELANALNNKEGSSTIRLEVLKKELENNRYLCAESVADIKVEIDSLLREKEKNNAQLLELDKKVKEYYELLKDHVTTGGTDEYAPFFTDIAQLTKRNAVIEIEIKELYASIGVSYEQDASGQWGVVEDKTLSGADDTQFKLNLEKLYNVMLAQTQTCETVITKLYEENAKINFRQTTAIEGGGANWLLGAAFGFVGVFVIASIVFVCVDRRKEKELAPAVSAFPAKKERELDAEAAVTEDKNDRE